MIKAAPGAKAIITKSAPVVADARKPAAKLPANPPAKAATTPAAKPAAKPPVAAPPASPMAKPFTASQPKASPKAETTMKMKELVEAVSKATGGKKKGVREIVEATLAAIGGALGAGSDLNLPLLGKAHVNRTRDSANGEILVIKLRRQSAKTKPGQATKLPLARLSE